MKLHKFNLPPMLLLHFLCLGLLAGVTSQAMASQIATGRAHSCGWDGVSGSQILCWGMEFVTGKGNLPVVKHLITLQAGGWHTCAHYINEENQQKLTCWGDGGFGVLNSSVTNYQRVVSLSVGEWHNCAVFALEGQDRVVDCWGREDVGQTYVPTDLDDVESVFAGLDYSCALFRESRKIRCWGKNATSASIDASTESVLGGTLACKRTDASQQPHCWLNASHNLNDFRSYRFGRDIVVEKNVIKNLDRGDGGGSPAIEDEIKSAFIGRTVIDVAVGEGHVCIIDTTGTHCEGANLEGQEEVPEQLREMGPIFHRIDHLQTFLDRLRAKVYSFDAAYLTHLLEKIDPTDVSSDHNKTIIFVAEMFIRQLGYSHLQTLYLKESIKHMEQVANPSQFSLNMQVYISTFIGLLDSAKVQLDMHPRELVSEGIAELGTQLAVGAAQLSPTGCEKLQEISEIFALHHYLYNRALNVDDAIVRLCKQTEN